MAEELTITEGISKQEKYEQLLPQVKALVEGESNLTANLANIASALKYGMDFFWVGFYVVIEEQLVLGPFQGPIACTRINKGKGVCGKSWEEKKAIIVPNVDEFPGHIACSSDSKSEIVIPFFDGEKVVMVLDVDSDKTEDFDDTDLKYLSKIGDYLQLKKN